MCFRGEVYAIQVIIKLMKKPSSALYLVTILKQDYLTVRPIPGAMPQQSLLAPKLSPPPLIPEHSPQPSRAKWHCNSHHHRNSAG